MICSNSLSNRYHPKHIWESFILPNFSSQLFKNGLLLAYHANQLNPFSTFPSWNTMLRGPVGGCDFPLAPPLLWIYYIGVSPLEVRKDMPTSCVYLKSGEYGPYRKDSIMKGLMVCIILYLLCWEAHWSISGISQMRQMRSREVKGLIQGHTVCKWLSLNSNLGLSWPHNFNHRTIHPCQEKPRRRLFCKVKNSWDSSERVQRGRNFIIITHDTYKHGLNCCQSSKQRNARPTYNNFQVSLNIERFDHPVDRLFAL